MVTGLAHSVVIAGAGPAGLALAAELGSRGVEVEIHAPAPRAPWSKSYGAWQRGLEGLGLESAYLQVFAQPSVISSRGAEQTLDACYCRLDSARLQRELLSRAEAFGVRIVEKTHTRTSLRSTPDRLCVDATGRGLGQTPEAADSYQSAYGLWIETPTRKRDAHAMVLMDFRGERHATPSFLYAMKEGTSGDCDRLFVEETVLSSRRPHDHADLKRRLLLRLADNGTSIKSILGEEFCTIPMGQRIPGSTEPTLAFGAAAGMVHPATGYQLSHALRAARPVADAIAENLSRGSEVASREALNVMWPEHRRQSWKLYRWSAAVLSDMNQEEMGSFVEAFFSLPTDQWLGFMEGTLRPRQIMRLLGGVFLHCSARLRLRLIRSSGSSAMALGRLLLAE